MVELAVVKPDTRDTALEALHEHGPMLLAAARVITLDDDEAKQAARGSQRLA